MMTKRLVTFNLALFFCLWIVNPPVARPQASGDTAQEHIQSGHAAYSRRDYKLAVREFKKAQSIDKALAEPYLMLAWVYRIQRKDKEAFKCVVEAIARQPNYPDAHFLMAKLYFETNKIRDSKRELDTAISQGAATTNVHVLQADLKIIDKDYQGAVAEYEEGARLADSSDPGLTLLRERIEALKTYVAFKEKANESNIKKPVPQNRPRPNYTDEARSNKVQGLVKEMVLVDETGRVRRVLELSRLGYGLDEQAVAATKAMRFSPATRDGKPVADWVVIEVEFNLR